MPDGFDRVFGKEKDESLDLLERALAYQLIDIEEFSMRSRNVVDATTREELEICLKGLESTPKVSLDDTTEFERLKAKYEQYNNIEAIVILVTTVLFLWWWLATDFPHPWISIILGVLIMSVISEIFKYRQEEEDLIAEVTKNESKDRAQSLLEARRIRRELEQ